MASSFTLKLLDKLSSPALGMARALEKLLRQEQAVTAGAAKVDAAVGRTGAAMGSAAAKATAMAKALEVAARAQDKVGRARDARGKFLPAGSAGVSPAMPTSPLDESFIGSLFRWNKLTGDSIDADCDGSDPVCLAPLPPEVNVSFVDATLLRWTAAGGAVDYCVYRGDAQTLRSTHVYTQAPGTAPGAAMFCGLATTELRDSFVPALGRAVFYLATGRNAAGESNLGTSSSGEPRPLTHACDDGTGGAGARHVVDQEAP